MLKKMPGLLINFTSKGTFNQEAAMWAIALVSIFGVCLSTGHEDPNDQTVKMEIDINPGQLSTNISRITGGVEAERHAYPWQVRMGVIFEDDDGKRRSKGCGGTIICPKFIMTAAHCLECVNKRKHPNGNNT